MREKKDHATLNANASLVALDKTISTRFCPKYRMRRTSRKQTKTKFPPRATTTCGRIESAQKNPSEFSGKLAKKLRGRRRSYRDLFRSPLRMAGENPIHVTHFVNDEDAERQAQQPGAHGEGVVQARESLLRIFERHGNRRGDQHHAGDGPPAAHQQIR